MLELYRLIWITFIWIALFACFFLVWFFSHRAKHRERTMMIEKGLVPDENSKKEFSFRFPWMKFGIVLIGLSIGLLIISLLSALDVLGKGGNPLPLAILGLSGGISMLIANRYTSDKSQQ